MAEHRVLCAGGSVRPQTFASTGHMAPDTTPQPNRTAGQRGASMKIRACGCGRRAPTGISAVRCGRLSVHSSGTLSGTHAETSRLSALCQGRRTVPGAVESLHPLKNRPETRGPATHHPPIRPSSGRIHSRFHRSSRQRGGERSQPTAVRSAGSQRKDFERSGSSHNIPAWGFREISRTLTQISEVFSSA